MPVVVLLTGPSSAGKTTLGRALQHSLPRPVVFLPGDEVDLLPDSAAVAWLSSLPRSEVALLEATAFDAYYAALASFARHGIYAIGEVMFRAAGHLEQFQRATKDVGRLLIHLSAPEAVRVDRERSRTDGRPGLAEATGREEWVPDQTDLEIDSRRMTTLEATTRVLDRLGPFD